MKSLSDNEIGMIGPPTTAVHQTWLPVELIEQPMHREIRQRSWVWRQIGRSRPSCLDVIGLLFRSGHRMSAIKHSDAKGTNQQRVHGISTTDMLVDGPPYTSAEKENPYRNGD